MPENFEPKTGVEQKIAKEKEMKPQEIERKFLIDFDSLPRNLEQYPRKEIMQDYLVIATSGTEVRLRREDEEYFLQIKSGGGKIRFESPRVEIPETEFNSLWQEKIGEGIEKTRYEISHGNGTIELDIYHGDLEGLVTAEMEFDSEEDSDKFKPPEWFGKEVTEDARYKNQSLTIDGNPLKKKNKESEEISEKEIAVSKIKNIEKEARPEYSLEEWKQEMTERVLEKLETQNKAIVNISGASASGKGRAIEELEDTSKEQDKRVLTIGTDDFYKGIARMIMEKVLEKNTEIESDPDEIYKATKDITVNKEFDQKFTDENIDKIINFLEKNNEGLNSQKIIQDIKDKFENIDFDNPDAVNLGELNEVILKLKNNQDAEIPKYDKGPGESIISKKVNGKDYDVILIEGIYGLNKKILSHSDIKSFIETDFKTLLMRRFRRDIFSGGTSFTPEFNLKLLLEKVLPAYQKHTLPDRKGADIILKNDYTIYETFDTKTFDVQDKIPVTKTEIENLEKQWGESLNTLEQKDYYFTNESAEHDPEHLLRVRVENGQLKDMVHKGTSLKREDGKIIRPTEEYIKEGEFGEHYKNIEDLLKSFKKGGFKLVAQFNKNRKIYQKDGIEIAVDRIENLGNFVEIRTNNQTSKAPEIDKFKEQYGLAGKRMVRPYIDEYLECERQKKRE